jgi:uncharacterized protein
VREGLNKHESMKPQTLTELERLQLINQYAILEKLDEENAEHWAECQEIVRKGYTLEYHKLFDPIWEEQSADDGRYVMDVLEMHQALQISLERLADKGDVKPEDIKFRGFSGNDETHLMAFTEKLRDEGRWSGVIGGRKDLDSHFPTTLRYQPMLEKWKAIGSPSDVERRYHLTKEELREILDEPSRRARTERAAK